MRIVKCCGMFKDEHIRYVNELKPDMCGFIINYEKSHRNVSIDTLRRLKNQLNQEINAVGVFVDENIDTVAGLLNEGLIDAVQLHGSEDDEYIKALKNVTGCYVIKAFVVKNEEDIKRASESSADIVLLDAGRGEGRCFDWELLRPLKRPYGLAGGLSPDNIEEALKTGAELFDTSGGIETDKDKDYNKMKAFIRAVRENANTERESKNE